MFRSLPDYLFKADKNLERPPSHESCGSKRENRKGSDTEVQPSRDVVIAIIRASLAVQLADAVMAEAFFAFAGIFQMNTTNGAQVHGSSSEVSAPSQQRSP